jgi:hypothetical protein
VSAGDSTNFAVTGNFFTRLERQLKFEITEDALTDRHQAARGTGPFIGNSQSSASRRKPSSLNRTDAVSGKSPFVSR